MSDSPIDPNENERKPVGEPETAADLQPMSIEQVKMEEPGNTADSQPMSNEEAVTEEPEAAASAEPVADEPETEETETSTDDQPVKTDSQEFTPGPVPKSSTGKPWTKKAIVAAVIVLLVGGAGFGYYKWSSPKFAARPYGHNVGKQHQGQMNRPPGSQARPQPGSQPRPQQGNQQRPQQGSQPAPPVTQ